MTDPQQEINQFENEGNQAVDKLKQLFGDLITYLNTLNIEDKALDEFVKGVEVLQVTYEKRMVNWKTALSRQRQFYIKELENQPEKIASKELKQLEHIRTIEQAHRDLKEKHKQTKEELATAKILVESYMIYEKKYHSLNYRYEELLNNTGNFKKR